MEIRVYHPTISIETFYIDIIKGNSDSLFAEHFLMHQIPRQVTDRGVAMKNGAGYEISYKKSGSAKFLDTTLNNLIKHGVLTISDQQKIVDKLNARGIKINYPDQPLDCCGDTYIEVKLQNKVRSFNLNVYPASANLKIKEFAKQWLLITDTGSIMRTLMNN